MANFPTLGGKEDASKFGFESEDVGIRSEMEGGYVLTRPLGEWIAFNLVTAL